MSNLVVLLLLVIMLPASPVAGAEGSEPPAGFPELRFSMNPLYHSIGLKFGTILSVRRERPFLSTFEGEMMMGLGSNPERAVDRACMQTILQQGTSTRRSRQRTAQEQQELNNQVLEECTLFNNPWRFSFLRSSIFDSMVPIKDNPVLIYYINYFVAPSHLLMRTNNQVLDVFPIQNDLNLEPNFRMGAWARLHPEAGVITGRIVQASLEFPFRKTFEIIIQESENANNFRAMSVNNGDLFRYITRAMLSGRPVRIEYVRLFSPHGAVLSTLFNYLTNLRVISVELVNDGRQ